MACRFVWFTAKTMDKYNTIFFEQYKNQPSWIFKQKKPLKPKQNHQENPYVCSIHLIVGALCYTVLCSNVSEKEQQMPALFCVFSLRFDNKRRVTKKI